MPQDFNYCHAIILVHGKSELLMAKYIKSNLKINLETISRNNGKNSIQVSGLLKFLKAEANLKNKKALLKAYNILEKNKKLVDFKIFLVMDLDDCTEEEIEKYKSGKMFENLWFKEYVVPIWEQPSFDTVMYETNYIKKLPTKNEKGKTYEKIFPTNQSGITNLEEIEIFNNKMKKCKNTNLEEMISYLLQFVVSYDKSNK